MWWISRQRILPSDGHANIRWLGCRLSEAWRLLLRPACLRNWWVMCEISDSFRENHLSDLHNLHVSTCILLDERHWHVLVPGVAQITHRCSFFWTSLVDQSCIHQHLRCISWLMELRYVRYSVCLTWGLRDGCSICCGILHTYNWSAHIVNAPYGWRRISVALHIHV